MNPIELSVERPKTIGPKTTHPNRRRRWSIAVFALVVLVLATAFFALRRLEQEITFHPVQFTDSEHWFKPPQAEDVWVRTSDGENLNGWFFTSGIQPAQASIIFFHGNGGNISNLGWVGERLAARGFDVLLIDYRGYGRSSGYSSSEVGIYGDADAAYDYLIKTRGASPERLVLYGQSIGTTAVADLASRRPCGAVILESGLSSARDMTAKLLPKALQWVHLFTLNRFDSAYKLALVRCPVLVTHGDPDSIIPTAQGRALFAAASEPKQLLIYPGSGHNVFGSQGEKYLDVLADFIRGSVKARP
jgi:pimeloyl-ACP methyl ester carboxylesterase